MSIFNDALVTRCFDDEDLVNTLTAIREVVKIRFQIAPGTEAGLGIANAAYRILSGDTEIANGQTNADGEVEVPLQPLLTGPVTVRIFDSDYDLSLHAGLDAATTLAGQQKRYDILGYITGYQLGTPGNAAPDDGRDGTRTQQALMNVQADSNISIDGTVGNQTRTQLTTKAGE